MTIRGKSLVALEVFENEPFAPSAEDAAYLARLLGGNWERREQGWAICRLVGHVALPSGESLTIRSRKAPAAALLAWFAYTDPTLRQLEFLGNTPEASSEGEFTALITRAFVRELLDAIAKHGLNRHYRRQRVRSGTIRGAIDFSRLVRQGGDMSRLPCNTWERLPETPLNRTLAAALLRICRDRVLRRATRRDLPAAMSALADVRPIADAELLGGAAKLSRTEASFEPLLGLARLILTSTGWSLGAEELGSAFLVNLETLFEMTVAKALDDAGVDGSAKAPVPYEHRDRAGSWKRRALEMDYFVASSPVGPIVVDAKYKSSVAAANLQQMVTYCFVTGAQRAVLVFPEGFVPKDQSYRFTARAGDGASVPDIVVSTVELATGATTVRGWAEAGAGLARAIGESASSESTPRRDPTHPIHQLHLPH